QVNQCCASAASYLPSPGGPFFTHLPAKAPRNSNIVYPSAISQVPTWSVTEPRRCPFCNSEGSFLGRRVDTLPVARCALCACCFVSDAPTEASLRTFYSKYQDYRVQDLSPQRAGWLKTHALALARRDRVVRLISSLKVSPTSRVLDVGCGSGGFL